MSNYKYMHFWLNKDLSEHSTHIMFRNKPIENWDDWWDNNVEIHRLDGPAVILIDNRRNVYHEYGKQGKTETW